eukprot:7784509-Pyramimonas_sp.AAC.1
MVRPSGALPGPRERQETTREEKLALGIKSRPGCPGKGRDDWGLAFCMRMLVRAWAFVEQGPTAQAFL